MVFTVERGNVVLVAVAANDHGGDDIHHRLLPFLPPKGSWVRGARGKGELEKSLEELVRWHAGEEKAQVGERKDCWGILRPAICPPPAKGKNADAMIIASKISLVARHQFPGDRRRRRRDICRVYRGPRVPRDTTIVNA